MSSAAAQTHPGQITFVDEDTGESKVQAATSVPDSVAFVPDANGARAAVVRITSHLRGSQRIIQSFGIDGALLQRTVQAPPVRPS